MSARYGDGVEILLLLAGLNPTSDAIRIMISACRLAIATYDVWIGYPDGDLTIVRYFWMPSVASTQSPYALPAVGDLRNVCPAQFKALN